MRGISYHRDLRELSITDVGEGLDRQPVLGDAPAPVVVGGHAAVGVEAVLDGRVAAGANRDVAHPVAVADGRLRRGIVVVGVVDIAVAVAAG